MSIQRASANPRLDAGADDFPGKPFAIAELRARARAVGRRRFGVRRTHTVRGVGYVLRSRG